MKALYSRAYLDHIAFSDMLVPFERYLYKLEHQGKEITKLKFHEKDFLFRAMHAFYEASGEKRYNVFKVPELKENLFYWIILLHSQNQGDRNFHTSLKHTIDTIYSLENRYLCVCVA